MRYLKVRFYSNWNNGGINIGSRSNSKKMGAKTTAKKIYEEGGGAVLVTCSSMYIWSWSLYWLWLPQQAQSHPQVRREVKGPPTCRNPHLEDQHDKVCGLLANRLSSKAWQLSATKGTALLPHPPNLISQFYPQHTAQGHCHGTWKLHYQCVLSYSFPVQTRISHQGLQVHLVSLKV